jgi:hypothetical protein
VDKESYQIHRVEGDMVKTPSWWLKKIHVTLDYGGMNGIWVPLDTRAVVDVRLFGTHIVTAEAVRILAGTEDETALAERNKASGSASDSSRRIPSIMGSGMLASR